MFEWLEREIETIKTPKFHLVDGPAEGKLKDAVLGSMLPLSASYKEFVLKFGNAKLYRTARDGSYRVGVLAGPREALLSGGDRVYYTGFHDGATVYVRAPLIPTHMSIYEFESGPEERVADDFEEWLTASCAHARATFGKEQWAEVLRGPKPFTAKEEELIEARRRIQWRVLGIDAAGNHIFEVTNAGRRALPVLTVGARSKNGRLNGAIRLDISGVGPGQTAVLHADCYKDLMPPTEIEPFALPDPEPEDRERYWEFGTA
jgi:hypothetical protein